MPRSFDLLRLRLRSLFRRTRVEQELDEEVEYHLQREIEERIASGIDPEEARYAAMRELGAITQNKEECRDMRRVNWIEDLVADLRYGVRMLHRNPAFTALAVLALAVGIGATTTIFSVAYGTLLRPLPYVDADRVAVVTMRFFPRDFAFGTLCIKDYLTWRENNHAFQNPSLFRNRVMDVGGKEGVPEQVQGTLVTAGFFSTLGMQPIIGRTFSTGEDRPNSANLTVLSEEMWRRRFGASSSVLGETILVNGAESTVIGVMPANFKFPPNGTQLWTNLVLNPPERYGPWFYRGVARLKPGATMEQAQADLNNVAARLMQDRPEYKRLAFPALPLRDAMLGTTVKPAILVLAGAVGLVLLIAVVNVANLMLARATVREREMAVRLSLGAAARRLVRQLLVESVLLSIAGGFVGTAIAWGAIEWLRVANPGNLPLIDAVRMDGRALAFAVLVSVATGILFGLAPAFASVRADLNSTMKDGGRTGWSQARGRARAVLVVAEIALSLVLLVGAGLLFRSFVNLQGVDGGFTTPAKNVLTLLLSPGNPKYRETAAGLAFYDELLRRARSVPGVEMAAVTDSLPPNNQGDADSFGIEGQVLPKGVVNPIVSDATAGPGFFETLGIPLKKGRYFSEQDSAKSEPVAIVSEGFARRFLPNQEPIGKRIRQSGAELGNPWLKIVGVVGNVKYLGLGADSEAAYYMAFAQSYSPRMFLVVRTSGDARLVANAVRDAVQSVDRGLTIAWTRTLDETMRESVSQPRFDTALIALFAGIALLLASIGIYGLIAYWVVQRTQEIGVRMALGASPLDVVRIVVRQGSVLAVAGISAGVFGALVLTRLLRSMLFGVAPTDAATFVAVALGMLAVVLVAAIVPAIRATRISPVIALRYE